MPGVLHTNRLQRKLNPSSPDSCWEQEVHTFEFNPDYIMSSRLTWVQEVAMEYVDTYHFKTTESTQGMNRCAPRNRKFRADEVVS